MRINETVESRKALEANRKRRAEIRQEAYNNAVKAQDNIRESIYVAVEKRKVKENAHRTLIEGARDDALGTSLKAIYISALNPYSLTDNAIIYAESLVDAWIKENGGATKILSEHKNDTYLLNRLATIVEDAAQEEVKDVEEDADKKEDPSEKKDDDKSEDKKDDSDDKKEDEKDSEDKSDDKESKDDSKDNEDDDSEEDNDEDSDDDDLDLDDDDDDEDDDSSEEDDDDETDDSDEDDNDLGTVGLDDDDDDFEEPDPDEDALEDDDVNDALGDPISDDEDDDDDPSIDDGEEKGKLFDDLNKEPDIKKAVNIIQQRVADAEEDFIKNNAEDKKKINDLITKVSDNVKTVENINNKDDDKSKVAEEAARIYNRKIEAIREARPLTIFEKMTRQLAGGLLKDEVVKEQFIDENGKFDMGAVIEAAKVQYTFLETLNTLQLETFTEDKLNKILEEVGSNN